MLAKLEGMATRTSISENAPSIWRILTRSSSTSTSSSSSRVCRARSAGRRSAAVRNSCDSRSPALRSTTVSPRSSGTDSHGVEGCNYLLAPDMEMDPLPGYEMANWEDGYGDFGIAPDLATLRDNVSDLSGAAVPLAGSARRSEREAGLETTELPWLRTEGGEILAWGGDGHDLLPPQARGLEDVRLVDRGHLPPPHLRRVEDGVVVTRTDSLGAGLTQQIAVSHKPGDIGDQYNSFLDCEEVTPENGRNGDVIINRNGKMMRPKRLASNLYQFRAGTGEDRCVLDSITSLQNGADLLWIETEKPHIEQIAKMVDRIREVIPNAKLAYNNSPSFNWTLNFRWQVYDAMKEAGKDVSKYNRAELMKVEYDDTPLAIEADERIRTFQADSAKRAGIFHHLITLPTYHTAALSTDNLAREYFGEQGMLGYVKNVQRQDSRQGIACAKHQNMAGSDIGDDHKEYFAGEAALKAGGAHNTMNQFG